MPRRQLGQASRRQHRAASPSDRLSELPSGMAKSRLIAAAAAQLHDRDARGALCVWRAGVCGHGAFSDVAGARNEDRDPGGAAMSSKLRGYVALAVDLRAGKTTPRAYLDECLKRIAELDGAIGAFVTLNKDGAIKAADASTARWRAAIPRVSTRSAKPAPSFSAKPPPRNSPPPIRGTRPRTRTIRNARRAVRRAARLPRSAPAWCRLDWAPKWSARSCGH